MGRHEEAIKRMDAIARMKKQVKESITKHSYSVTDFYHNKGFAQWIAKHPRFEQFTLLVIALNAVWIWVDTDLNPGTQLILSPPLFQLVEHLFCIYFSYELTMRFLAFNRKRDGLRDFWFVFDSFLVATMIFETWILSIVFLTTDRGGGGGIGNASILRLARLLRLTRMGRMARVLRALPELLILIKGMIAALRSVCFALGLLIMILYVFGIAFTQLCEDTALEPDFATVLISMHTLLIYGSLMDEVSTMIKTIEATSIPILFLFYVFILLAALTVLNMLIGVICEMVSRVGETEREVSTVSLVTDQIQELILSSGADSNDEHIIVTKDVFERMLSNKEAVCILHEVGVDVVGLVDFADTIFEADDAQEAKQLTFGEFMGLILDLRGSSTARVRDIVSLRKHINYRFHRLESRLMDMDCLARYQREAALSGERTPIGAIGAKASARAAYVQANETPSQSHLSGMTTLATFKDIAAGSLRELQASHERELALLHDENLQLLDRLTDLGRAAGKSHAGVLEVSTKVPRTPPRNFSDGIGTVATTRTGSEGTTSPSTREKPATRELSKVSDAPAWKTAPLVAQVPLQQWHEYYSSTPSWQSHANGASGHVCHNLV